jgi:hypothetical protein
VFNRYGRIIYTPFWEMPLSHWYVVDDDMMQRTQNAKEHLKNDLC